MKEKKWPDKNFDLVDKKAIQDTSQNVEIITLSLKLGS